MASRHLGGFAKEKLLLVCCSVTVLGGCDKPSPDRTQPDADLSAGGNAGEARSATERTIDACSLLTSQEIEAVHGEAVQETKADWTSAEGFVISQCHFVLPTASNSVTLRVVQGGSGHDARDPGRVWKETFARDLADALKHRKKSAPEVVPNVGDEAYWMGGPVSGGLYVLKGNHYIRLGPGGETDQSLKIERATKLARAILKRL